MPRISIIVPIYGVERSIARCARSLFNQTMEDIEYIFVDDCSPDNSILILSLVANEFSRCSDRVTIIHHTTNAGISQARSTGLSYAHGDYVFFCDSDDYVEADMCDVLYQTATQTGSDMVVCDFVNEYHDCPIYESGKGSDDKICLLNEMLRKKTPWVVWNRLVKRSLFQNDIRFTNYSMAEDLLLTTQLVYYANKISFIEQGLYHYCINTNSFTHNRIPEKQALMAEQAIRNTDWVISFFRNRGIYEQLILSLDYTKYYQKQLLFPLIENDRYYEMWKQTYSDLHFKVWRMRLPIKDKIKFYLALCRLYK